MYHTLLVICFSTPTQHCNYKYITDVSLLSPLSFSMPPLDTSMCLSFSARVLIFAAHAPLGLKTCIKPSSDPSMAFDMAQFLRDLSISSAGRWFHAWTTH